MKFLVIGLGSMGKRRVRNLQALGNTDIAGFDLREDRRREALDKYSIATFADFNEALTSFKPDVFVISTPPDTHMTYAYSALENSKPAFIEASVVDAHKIARLEQLSIERDVMILPSCTMRFFPGPMRIRELVEQNVIGELLNINYHVGQYLPDWHPWEDVSEFYVSKRETGAAREIVPFELTWLNALFGNPTAIACDKRKKGDFNADIDDIYNSLIRYDSGPTMNLTVDVLARPVAVRSMRIIGAKGIIEYDGEQNLVRFINDKDAGWQTTLLDSGTVEKDYIYSEEPYIKEMDTFLKALESGDRSHYPNSLTKDAETLETLYALEKLA